MLPPMTTAWPAAGDSLEGTRPVAELVIQQPGAAAGVHPCAWYIRLQFLIQARPYAPDGAGEKRAGGSLSYCPPVRRCNPHCTAPGGGLYGCPIRPTLFAP